MADLQTSESFYEILDGSIYDKTLLQAAEEAAKDGEVSYEATKCLWTKVGDEAGRISEVDLRTMDYIMRRHKFERTALYFLKEAVKMEKELNKAREREEGKIAGATTPRKKRMSMSPTIKSPKVKGRKEEPYEAVVRITEEISQATSLSQVKRLQAQLAKLTPMKEPNPDREVEAEQDGAVRKKRLSTTPKAPKAPKAPKSPKSAPKEPNVTGRGRGRGAKEGRGRGRGMAGAAEKTGVVGSTLLKGAAKKLRKGRKAQQEADEPEVTAGLIKRPAAEAEQAPPASPMRLRKKTTATPPASPKSPKSPSGKNGKIAKKVPASPKSPKSPSGNNLKLKKVKAVSKASEVKEAASPKKVLLKRPSAAVDPPEAKADGAKKRKLAKKTSNAGEDDKSSAAKVLKRPAAAAAVAPAVKRPAALPVAVDAD